MPLDLAGDEVEAIEAAAGTGFATGGFALGGDSSMYAPGTQKSRVSGEVLRWHHETGTEAISAVQYMESLEREVALLRQQVRLAAGTTVVLSTLLGSDRPTCQTGLVDSFTPRQVRCYAGVCKVEVVSIVPVSGLRVCARWMHGSLAATKATTCWST